MIILASISAVVLNGVSVGADTDEVQLNVATDAISEHQVDIGMDGSGNTLAAWLADAGEGSGGPAIIARSFDPTGSGGSEIVVRPTPAPSESQVDDGPVVDVATGVPGPAPGVIAWVAGGAIEFARYASDGAALGGVQTIEASDPYFAVTRGRGRVPPRRLRLRPDLGRALQQRGV